MLVCKPFTADGRTIKLRTWNAIQLRLTISLNRHVLVMTNGQTYLKGVYSNDIPVPV